MSTSPTKTSTPGSPVRPRTSHQQLLSQVQILQQKQLNRRSVPNMKLANFSQEDLKSYTSSSSSNKSHEKLKLLSNSPISKRLHVSNIGDSQYVIPIPFTLQLPPKLSQKNITKETERNDAKSPASSTSLPKRPKSGSSLPKRVKLIYTGTKYERLETSSGEEDSTIIDDDLSNYSFKAPGGITRVPTIPMPPRPNKNPFSAEYIVSQLSSKVISPDERRRTAKLISSDELSIIEEASNSAASSRQPSLKEQTVIVPILRNAPIQSAPNQQAVNERKHSIHKRSFSDESHISSVSSLSSVSEVLFKHPLKLDSRKTSTTSAYSESSTESTASTASWNSLQKSIDISLGEVELMVPIKQRSVVAKKSVFLDKSLPPTPIGTIKRGPAEIESDWVDDDTESSVLLAAQDLTEIQEEIEPLRVSRVSTLLGPPVISHSRQPDSSFEKSIEIDEYYFNDMESVSTAKYSEVTVSTHHEPLSRPNTMRSTVTATSPLRASPLRVNQVITNSPPMVVNKRIVSVDNQGIGKSFSFPNSLENATNSLPKPKEMPNSSSVSRFSLFKHGQIEIPDLNDRAVSQRYSTSHSSYSYNGTNFEDMPSESEVLTNESNDDESSILEPIGIPTRAANNLFKQTMQTCGSDSDSEDSAKASLYAAPIQAKSTPNLKLTPLKSPIKHQRHKSMHTIDFDASSIQSSHASNIHVKSKLIGELSGYSGHTKSRLIGNIKTKLIGNINGILMGNFNQASPFIKDVRVPSPPRKVRNLPERMDIIVTEPPAQVNYAVDFKEAQLEDEEDVFSVAPTIDDISLSQHLGFRPPNDARVLQITKELTNLKLHGHQEDSMRQSHSGTSSSSYQSSNSAKPESNSSASDTESIVIDLTKDNYDVCLINRLNSTTSYKSIIEKSKEGKDIEVVLVDEEDDSELMSLYSKYRNDSWLFRSLSSASNVSTTSTASTTSFAPSAENEKQSLLKSHRNAAYQTTNSLRAPHLKLKTGSLASEASTVSENYNSRRIQRPAKSVAIPPYTSVSNKRHTVSVIGSNYLDYNTDNYDFDSYMKQQQQL